MKDDVFPGLALLMFISAATYFLIHQFGLIIGGVLSMLLTIVALILFVLAAYVHGSIERHLLRRSQKGTTAK